MRYVQLIVVSGLLLAAAGCGKKGPPLTPFVRVPEGVGAVEVRRIGGDVFLTFAVPTLNIDKSRPADVRRIDVYAVTSTEPRPPSRLLEGATLVGVVNVTPSPPPGTTPLPPPPPAGVLPPATQELPVQGNTVTVQDRLDPNAFVPVPLAQRPIRQPAAVRTPVTPDPPPRLQRTYVVVPFSARGRSGPPSAAAVVSLEPLPPAPASVQAVFSAEGVTVSWEPSGGLIGFLVDKQLPIEALPIDDDAIARRAAAAAPAPGPGPTRYNVYQSLVADPLQLPAPALARPRWQFQPQRPMNPQPLDAQQAADALEFERERCYVVRAVQGSGNETVESAPSPTACVKPVDVYPPAPPQGLTAVAAEGAISLIWEASTSDDVTGYLVLRGEGADATLLPVTPSAVVETRFVDRAVSAGTTYVYAVVAVDGRIPLPNTSEPSAHVEETAR